MYFMLSVIMLSVVMLNVIMLSVVMLNGVMLNVVAPYRTRQLKGRYVHNVNPNEECMPLPGLGSKRGKNFRATPQFQQVTRNDATMSE
jgi:hypothetical protein